MARKQSVSKRSEMAEVAKINQELNEEMKLKHPPILRDVGGSISNLPVNTPEYKKWIAKHIERNGFIGHHLPAPELGTRYELGEEVTVEDPQQALTQSDLDTEESPEETVLDASSDSTPPAPIIDSTDDKYIDLCIIENSTKKLLGRPIDEIEKDAVEALKNYRGDASYQTPLNIESCIQASEQMLLENKEKENGLLGNDIKPEGDDSIQDSKNNDET